MNEIALIDIEASGLHFDSYPIEVAVLLGDECRSWLIKPEPGWRYWCRTAESMHGIRRETLEKEGLPVIDVVKQLNRFLTGFSGVLYSDADRWDADWIDTLYYAANEVRGFCIDSIYHLLDGEKGRQFDRHKALLAESGRYRHHRAAEDVRMISQALHLTNEES